MRRIIIGDNRIGGRGGRGNPSWRGEFRRCRRQVGRHRGAGDAQTNSE